MLTDSDYVVFALVAVLMVLVGMAAMLMGFVATLVPWPRLRMTSTRGRGAMTFVAGVGLFILGGALIPRPDPSTETTTQRLQASGKRGSTGPTDTASSSVASMHPLAQAKLAFVGGSTRDQIKELLDGALPLYGLPVTDENYSRAASALVALRKANGTPEMAILDYMIRSHVPGVNLTFPQAAGISSTFLRIGDK